MPELPKDTLPGGNYALIGGALHPASYVQGRDHATLLGADGETSVPLAAIGRLFSRAVHGLWQDEPVTIWRSKQAGLVKLVYAGKDWDRAQAIGMRGDRTMWETDVSPEEVTFLSAEETDRI